MAANRAFSRVIIVVECIVLCILTLFLFQCAKPKGAKPGGVKLALKPEPNETTNYRITTQMRRSIKWEGPVPEKSAFEESFNDDRIETVVTQRIQSADANRGISAQITINGLKYFSIVKNQTTVDFDSTRLADASSPLAKLMGQSYVIEFGPDNSISNVSDLSAVKLLVNGTSPEDHAGQNVLQPAAITERHATLLLPQAGQEQLRPGDTWKKVKSFSFGMMGVKSYEKIYTLREIKETEGHKIAVIDMRAIPSAEVESRFRDKQAGANFPKMFDTNDIFTGTGVVDLTAGRIDSYSENLQANWVAAIPPTLRGMEDVNGPVVLRMSAVRSYNLERVK